MKTGLKIVTIGGGSSYSPELIEGFIKRSETLPVRELWLVDIEAGKEKLDIITDLAKRMVRRVNANIEIHSTLNRREALKNADFVTTQFRVGQLDARKKDEIIPAKYGILGQETNGPGGMFKALRTIPVLIDIIHDCQELCPDAWIISFTNPAGLNAEAVLRYTGWKKFIGLCNSPTVIVHRIGRLMNLDPKQLRVDFAGLNHMVFGLHTYYQGQDISKQVIDALAAYNDGKTYDERFDTLPYTPAFLHELNCIPSPYLRYYFYKDIMLQHAIKEAENGCCRAQVVKRIEQELFAKYADPALDVKPKELEQRGGAYYSDAACSLIDSIYNDRGDIQVVNTLNNGGCASFAADEVVEISSVITKEGPRPITVGRLPDQVEGLCRHIKSFEKLTAKAAIEGNRETALFALTMNPLVQDEALAKALLEELMEAHREYLPQFYK